MRNSWLLLGLVFLSWIGMVDRTSTQAAAPPTPASTLSAISPSRRADMAKELAGRIDRHINEQLKVRKVVAAPRSSDAEFVRRVYLDLVGRIPHVSEARTFLESRDPDKRQKLVESLLQTPQYVNYLTSTWRNLLIPTSNNPQAQFLAGQIDAWIRDRIQDNQPYDQTVRDLLTITVASNNPPARPVMNLTGRSAVTFYQINEMKADNLAAATSRLFLGVKLECAQCHDHPFAEWTRQQFWETAAFFAGIKATRPQAGIFSPATDDVRVHTIAMPGNEKQIQARFLDGTQPKWGDQINARQTFAEWVTSKQNPFFARTAANRMWEHLFGIGLVDPVDDFRADNAPSHPELLDDLGRTFIDSGFDLKFLLHAITLTEAYQRTGELTHPSQMDLRAFGRMPLKGLTAEQLFDSLVLATGYREPNNPGVRRINQGTPRAEFLARFSNPIDRRTEPQTSILQALALMNGRFIADATSLERSEILSAINDSPFFSTRQKLDALFLATLSRPMRPSEASRLEPYVSSGGPSGNSGKALADVFWVLLNSSEFLFNH